MAVPRSQLVDPGRSGCYHLVSRCVRRAFLCGDGQEHRRQWIEDGLKLSASAFAVDILAFAVMSNHMHVVVRTDPERAQAWSDREVTERWARLFPMIDTTTAEAMPWPQETVERYAADPEWVAIRRGRLASLSWLMRLLKQRIARRANREDDCRGHFWEGRFTSVPLLDQGALIACMVYNDLNPIRAGMATTLEDSDHTSVQRRIHARQAHHQACLLIEQQHLGTLPPDEQATVRGQAADGPEQGLWIAPMARTRMSNHHPAIDLDDYLQLVERTGRLLVKGKRGAIPAECLPLFERLGLDAERWLAVMTGDRSFLGSAVGSLWHLVREAAQRGSQWIAETTAIHRQRRRPATG